jgi:hypothetical protein
VAPLSLFLWLVGSPARKRRKKAAEAAEAEAAKGAAPASGDGTV